MKPKNVSLISYAIMIFCLLGLTPHRMLAEEGQSNPCQGALRIDGQQHLTSTLIGSEGIDLFQIELAQPGLLAAWARTIPLSQATLALEILDAHCHPIAPSHIFRKDATHGLFVAEPGIYYLAVLGTAVIYELDTGFRPSSRHVADDPVRKEERIEEDIDEWEDTTLPPGDWPPTVGQNPGHLDPSCQRLSQHPRALPLHCFLLD